MKKYRFLAKDEVVRDGDELQCEGEDGEIYYTKAMVRKSRPMLAYGYSCKIRRPIPFTGKTAFDVFYSPGLRIIIDTDGLGEDEICEKLAEAAEKKFRAGFEAYMKEFAENIDWGQTRECVECPYEPGDDGGDDDFTEKKYRTLEIGETIQEGDEVSYILNQWVSVSNSIGQEVRGSGYGKYRRPITEPQYRPFREGDVIEGGDQFIGASGDWAEIMDWYRGGLTSDMIENAKYRKLIK